MTYDIKHIVNNTTYWSKDETGNFIARYYNPDDEDDAGTSIMVKPDDLHEIHPSLPDAMHAMFQDIATKVAVPHILSSRVLDTIDLLNKQFFECTDSMGNTCRILKVISLDTCDSKMQCVSIRGRNLIVESGVINGKTITYVSKTEFNDYIINVKNLNKRYPGWQQRLQVTKAMDMDQNQATMYIFPFSTKTHGMPTLPDSDFNQSI